MRQIERANAPLPEEVVQEIVARSDGVPLFLEEVTRAVLEAAETDAGGERHAAPASATRDRARSFDLARLADRTPGSPRIGRKEIAQLGAAIGREFSYELLAATSQHSLSDLEDALARLVDKGLIFQSGSPPQATFLFKHALVQDAAYSTLLQGCRGGKSHARIADAMLAASPAGSVAPEIVALHMQQCRAICRSNRLLAEGRRTISPASEQSRSGSPFPPRPVSAERAATND